MLYNSKKEWQKLVQETRQRSIVEENGYLALKLLLGEMKKMDQEEGMIFEFYKSKGGLGRVIKGGGGGSGGSGGGGSEEEEVDLGGASTVSTWGDLQTVLGSIQHAKELEKMKAKGGKIGKAASIVLGVIPGADGVKNLVKGLGKGYKFIKSAGGLKDTADQFNAVMDAFKDVPDKQAEKAGGVMDTLKIDDGYQTITDDRIEDGFIKWFAGKIGDKNPDDKIPNEDINHYFEEYVKDNVGTDLETVQGAATDTKFTDIPMVKDKGKVRKALGAVGNSLGGFFSGLLDN